MGCSSEDDILKVALNYYGDDALVPRLPTTEELSRRPREVARWFLQWLHALLQNNPLLDKPRLPWNIIMVTQGIPDINGL
jgi:hypothetical protein